MQLPVQITLRNITQPPSSNTIEALIREKAAGLDSYYDRIMSCHVLVERPHRHRRKGEHYLVRIEIIVPGGEIVVKREPSLHATEQDLDTEQVTKDEELETSHKHLKVAIREAFETARRRLQDYARRQRLDIKSHPGQQRGRISSLVPARDHGYIEAFDGREIYFHKNSVVRGDFEHFEIGNEVAFEEERGDKGPQASTVRMISKGRPRRKAEKVKKRAV